MSQYLHTGHRGHVKKIFARELKKSPVFNFRQYIEITLTDGCFGAVFCVSMLKYYWIFIQSYLIINLTYPLITSLKLIECCKMFLQRRRKYRGLAIRMLMSVCMNVSVCLLEVNVLFSRDYMKKRWDLFAFC